MKPISFTLYSSSQILERLPFSHDLCISSSYEQNMQPISSHCSPLHKSSKGCIDNHDLFCSFYEQNMKPISSRCSLLHKAAFQYEWSVHSSRCLQNMKPISSHGSLLRKFLQGWFQVMIFAFQNFSRNISHSHHIEVSENYIDWVPMNSSIEQKQEVVPDVLSSLSSRIWSLSSSSVWSGAQVMLKSFANPWSIWWCFPAFSDFGTSIEMTMMKSSTTSVTQKHQPIRLFDQKFLGKKLILVTSWLLLFFTPIDCVLPINWWPLKSRLSPLLK